MLIFSLDADPAFAQALTDTLDRPLAAHEHRRFPDGECKLRPLVDPCGADTYVVHSLHGEPGDSPHDKLCRLLMFIATLRDHGAAKVTAVVPYLAYGRKDRQTKPQDPLNLRYVAQLFEAVGTAQLITLEAHNVAAFQNAFRCTHQAIEAHPAFFTVAQEAAQRGPIAVASPDPGGVKRAQLWREALEERLQRPVGFAMIDKRRSEGELGGSGLISGDVAGATVLLLDDLIATGKTLQLGAVALRAAGAQAVVCCAAHGLFVEPAAQTLMDEAISALVVSDSVPPLRLPPDAPLRRKLRVLSCVPLFAQALRRSHEGWRR